MTDLLIAPAKDSGCEDLAALTEVVETAASQQRSPVDDILDSGQVDEEPYLSGLAAKAGMAWVSDAPEFENVQPLRDACGPKVALGH
ncbi:MAG: type II/IV secretion system protein, partial [Akkermansiaceae bacterium]